MLSDNARNMTVQKNKEKSQILKINVLQNRYLTDVNIRTIDETIFNESTILFSVVNLKTRAIVGYVIYRNFLNEDIIMELYDKLFF